MLNFAKNCRVLILLLHQTFQFFYPVWSCHTKPMSSHSDAHIPVDGDNFNLHYVWQYFVITKHAAKEGWAKKAICNFVSKASVDEAIPE